MAFTVATPNVPNGTSVQLYAWQGSVAKTLAGSVVETQSVSAGSVTFNGATGGRWLGVYTVGGQQSWFQFAVGETAGPGAAVSVASLGLGSGGFVRHASGTGASTPAPICDLSGSGKSVNNPALFTDPPGVSGAKTCYVYAAVNPGTATASNPVGTSVPIDLWSGPSMDQLAHQGSVVTLPGTGSVAGITGLYVASACGVVQVGGAYHQWIVAVDGWAPLPTKGGILHYTAPAPAGPWTCVSTGVELATQGTEVLIYDNSMPVFFNGQWVMAAMVLKADNTHQLCVWKASSLSGPWTRVGFLTELGGYGLSGTSGPDSPALVVDGDRLLLYISTVGFFSVFYDVSDLANASYLGPCFLANPSNADEMGDGAFGDGAIWRDGNDVWLTYQSVRNPEASNYWKAYAAKWQPGKMYVPVQTGVPAYILLGATNIGKTNTQVNIPSWVPSQAHIVDVMVAVRENTTYTALEAVGVVPPNALDIGTTVGIPPAVGVNQWARMKLPINPGHRWFSINPGSTTTQIIAQAFLMGFDRLP